MIGSQPSPSPAALWSYGAPALLVGLAMVGSLYLWAQRKDGQQSTQEAVAAVEDPRSTYETPFRNVRPEVKYVGDDTCARCHTTIAESYHRHPMGRSLAPVASRLDEERLDKAANNPFEAAGFQYEIRRDGDRLIHQEIRRDSQGRVITATEAEVQFVLGSGALGRSYLINRDGFLFQSPISWYTQKQSWGLAPGYEQNHTHFERPAPASCLSCHCNQANPIRDTVNRYATPAFQGFAIGCERCHGPGELHVQSRQRGEMADPDYSIVNPRHLAPDLREAICQQCHLQGEMRIVPCGRGPFDFRPGMPLSVFSTVFVLPAELNEHYKAVSHVEQMHVSRCFRATRGKKEQLGCVSCHDPHKLPAAEERVAYYRDRCLRCHGEQNCSLAPSVRRQKQADDSCVACHLTGRHTDIAHTAISDHRILRSPDSVPSAEGPTRRLHPDVLLIPFHPESAQAAEGAVFRDLALALVHLARQQKASPDTSRRIALPLLQTAVRTRPDDPAAWEGLGIALLMQGQAEDAQAAFATALAQAPNSEVALENAALVAGKLGQRDKAIGYWERAIAINPWSSLYHFELARLLSQRPDWTRTAQECQAVLRINPGHKEARMLLIVSLRRSGNEERAQAEFATLLALNPDQREELRRWLAQVTP